jgi:hypothetical protein
VIALVAAYWIAFGLLVLSAPLSLKDLDFNADGHVSLWEAIDGVTIRHQEVLVDGRKCIDYFEPKTGSQWRLMCE